jgi:GH15 family glucan-1,4-alpha-glucosidase
MPSQSPMLAADLAEIAERGRALILSLQDAGGAYPASPTFSAYRGYSWLRDGAFIADAMSSAGEIASASVFFDWCSRALVARAPDIRRIVAAARSGSPVADNEMLPTRFALDGSAGEAEWWDFQLDGYGLWLWAALVHAERHGLDISPWRTAIELTVDYLVSSWDRPCYDWWEEHVEEVHVSTLGSVEAGLRAASGSSVLDPERRRMAGETADAAARLMRDRGTVDGHLVKWIGSSAVDASLAALIAPLNVVPGDSALGRATLAELERQLVVGGGTHRFTADTYYGGGQWPLLSCFVGLAHLDAGDPVRARELLEWAAGTARPSGTMPEQVDDHLIDRAFVDEWVQRWGPSADPLLWSSAMFLRLAVALGVVAR